MYAVSGTPSYEGTFRTPLSPGATTACVRHPSRCSTRPPSANSGAREAITRPSARPSRGAPTSHPLSISSRW